MPNCDKSTPHSCQIPHNVSQSPPHRFFTPQHPFAFHSIHFKPFYIFTSFSYLPFATFRPPAICTFDLDSDFAHLTDTQGSHPFYWFTSNKNILFNADMSFAWLSCKAQFRWHSRSMLWSACSLAILIPAVMHFSANQSAAFQLPSLPNSKS